MRLTDPPLVIAFERCPLNSYFICKRGVLKRVSLWELFVNLFRLKPIYKIVGDIYTHYGYGYCKVWPPA